MGKNSRIEWCTHTFNPWWGCTKVSAACTHCYAESLAKRTGNQVWGDQATRRFFGQKHWTEPLKWDRQAEAEAVRKRVFCASMADIFEIHPNPAIAAQQADARRQLATLIERTKNLDWLLLTKRPENWPKICGQLGWCFDGERWYEPTGRIWVGVTAENQEQADRRIPALLKIPAAVRFVSYEPALGPLTLSPWLQLVARDAERMSAAALESGATRELIRPGIDWVIAGGESGGKARPAHPDWFRSVRDQCAEEDVPFLFKQWGEWLPSFEQPAMAFDDDPEISRFSHVVWDPENSGWERMNGMWDDTDTWFVADNYADPEQEMSRVGKKIAGRLLDGREHNGFPEVLS